MGLVKICVAMSVATVIHGCNPKTLPPPQPSNDVQEMHRLLKLPLSMRSARWEVFTYPDSSNGLLPDNYESTTFVAEISPMDATWFSNSAKEIEINWTSPNAARSWLTESSRKILSDESLDLKSHKCSHFATELVKNNRAVDGFVCESAGQVLLYLLLDEKS
jgi:hypothetical protein